MLTMKTQGPIYKKSALPLLFRVVPNSIVTMLHSQAYFAYIRT